ncbi:DUF4376 domain-containing protein [Pandoraea communis]|uniref:DUF4376 domain-containing protein n=1 Tax=Pandoraea communis TaxID=2508297 RepID=UPI0025A62728|nr:DUF4376 domain-containing protein [Pandoraea communis]MDM8356681.1 DUF4376 domain-containing protein [Pandoraea communis]
MFVDQFYQDAAGGLHFLSALDHDNAAASGLPLPDPSWAKISNEAADAIQHPPLTLSQAQDAQIALIDAAYAAAVTQSVMFAASGGTPKAFQADIGSQTVLFQATQGYTIAGAVPDGFYWKAEDNSLVPFTLSDLKGLYEAMLAQGWAAFQKRTSLKANIRAATTTTVQAVQAITWG